MNYSLLFLLLFYKVFISYGVECPGNSDKYILRDGKLCQKIYNCDPGNEIIACKDNCSPEECHQCSIGKVQPFQIHSTTEPETYRKCFMPLKECRNRELVPIRNGTATPGCSKADACQCDLANCWFGRNPCSCNKYKQCLEDEYLVPVNDGESASCKKCPKGTRKRETGCGPCQVIDSLNQSMTTASPAIAISVTSEISSLPSNVSNTADTSRSLHVLWTAIGVGLTVVIIVVLVLVIYLRRKCRFSGTPKQRNISDEENLNGAEDNQKDDDTEHVIPIERPLIVCASTEEDLTGNTPKSPIVSETEQPVAFHPCDPRALRQRHFNDRDSSMEDDSYTTNYPETTESSEETNFSNQQSYTETPLVDTIERSEGVDYLLNKLNVDNSEVKQPVQCEEEALSSQTSQKLPHSDFTHQKEMCDWGLQSLTEEKLLCSTQISDKTHLKHHIDSLLEDTQQKEKTS